MRSILFVWLPSAMAMASVSPAQLRALTSIATMRSTLASLPPTAALPDTSELRQAAASLLAELDALALADPSTLLGLDAPLPRLKASLVEENLAEEAQELAKLQEQRDDEERSRQLFQLIDKSNDGLISVDEFIGAVPAIFAPGVLTGQQQVKQMERLFKRLDLNGDNTLDRSEFAEFISSLKSEMAAPLLASREVGLRRLIVLTLDVCGLSLARDLSALHASRWRVGWGRGELCEIQSSVVRWCALAERAEEIAAEPEWFEPQRADSPQQAADRTSSKSEGQRTDESSMDQLEALAADAATLATELRQLGSKLDIGRHARQAFAGMRASLRFCLRGLGIMGGDAIKAVRFVGRRLGGQTLTESEVAVIRRTIVDWLCLIRASTCRASHLFAASTHSVLSRMLPFISNDPLLTAYHIYLTSAALLRPSRAIGSLHGYPRLPAHAPRQRARIQPAESLRARRHAERFHAAAAGLRRIVHGSDGRR